MKHARSYEAYEGVSCCASPSVKSRPLILLTIRRTRRLNRRDLLVTKPLEIPLEIPPSSLSNLWRRVATGVRESVAGPVRNGGKSWKKRGLCVTSRLDPFPTSPRWREGRISYESFLGSWHFPPSFSPLVSWPSPVTIIHFGSVRNDSTGRLVTTFMGSLSEQRSSK